jgi:hypothetical protein
MAKMGFEDVVEKPFHWPTSTWARRSTSRRLLCTGSNIYFNGLEAIISLNIMGETSFHFSLIFLSVIKYAINLSNTNLIHPKYATRA